MEAWRRERLTEGVNSSPYSRMVWPRYIGPVSQVLMSSYGCTESVDWSC